MAKLTPCVFGFVLCSAFAFAMSVPVPLPTPDSISGAWLGGGGLEYLRLEIHKDGRGILTVQYLLGEKADAYIVLSTKISKYSLNFAVEPDSSAEPIFVRGRMSGDGLHVEFGNTAHRWSRKVTLEPESNVISRIDSVTKRAREFSSTGASQR